MSWLEVPPALLRVFGRKLAQLQAEEALQLAAVVGVGTGSVKDPDAITSRWQRAAHGPRPRPTLGEQRAFAATLGIQIIDPESATGE